jgi:FkbM family methyltransferase
MKDLMRRFFWYWRSFLLRRFYPVVALTRPTEFHGSQYGGWAIIPNTLSEKSIVYSIGIGTDASFDISIINKYRCTVHGFDPTPKSLLWVSSNLNLQNFLFHPWALAAVSGKIELFLPKDDRNISGSMVRTDHLCVNGIVVEAFSLADIMGMLNHKYIDVLKMDIEGAEYDVIDSIIDGGLLSCIGQLLVEFHHFFYSIGDLPTQAAIEKLRENGWGVAWHSATGREILFVNLNDSK